MTSIAVLCEVTVENRPNNQREVQSEEEISFRIANVAQWLVQLYCKQEVGGSSPFVRSKNV